MSLTAPGEIGSLPNLPDCWVIVRVTRTGQPTVHRLFATWFENSISPAKWQMNSGIKAFKEHDTFIEFTGNSGSQYRCSREGERLSGYGGGVLGQLQKQLLDSGKGKIDIIRLEEFKSDRELGIGSDG